jgi:hypothetical protein
MCVGAVLCVGCDYRHFYGVEPWWMEPGTILKERSRGRPPVRFCLEFVSLHPFGLLFCGFFFSLLLESNFDSLENFGTGFFSN